MELVIDSGSMPPSPSFHRPRMLLRRSLLALVAWLALGCSSEQAAAPEVETVGPANGWLVVTGGGNGPAGFARLVELAGGPGAAILIVHTAIGDDDPLGQDPQILLDYYVEGFGLTDARLFHTRDRSVADSESFVEPLRSAQAVWLTGGRQWRLADAYLGTRVHDELFAVLERGGVIGGESAGSVAIGSFLFRGDTSGNDVLIGDHLEGFGFLRGVAIDTHVAQRGRRLDLVEALRHDGSLLGLGIDEDTFIVVQGNELSVAGQHQLHVHDTGYWPDEATDDEDRVFSLGPGDRYDLARRQVER